MTTAAERLTAAVVVRSVECPECLSPPKVECLIGARFKHSPHRARYIAARKALGLPLPERQPIFR